MNSNFIFQIFHKTYEELMLSDIENFFSEPQEETSILEFKSGDVEIIDLYKEIAAFLNTEGGIIIVGSPKEKKDEKTKGRVKLCSGPLTYSNFSNKDWLYQKIASNIVPCPTGIRIKQFLLDHGGIFIIDIPQSVTPPHQCSADGKYYIRMEAEAKPAPHGIIKALFDKRRSPVLTSRIIISSVNSNTDNVIVSFHNKSNIPADQVSFIIDFYNVSGVAGAYSISKYNDPALGEKFSISVSTNQVLASIVAISVDVNITHKFLNYLIFVGYWCKESDFDFQFWTYNPELKKIENEGDFKNSDLKILDALKLL